MECTKGNAKKIRFCLEYVTLKDTILTTKFVDCNKSYEREFDNDLAKRFETPTDSVTEKIINFVW